MVIPTTAQQINGREGETATLLLRRLVSLNLRGGGFAPRHLNRSIARGKYETLANYSLNNCLTSVFVRVGSNTRR